MRLHEDLLTFDEEGIKRMIEFGDGGLNQPMGIVLQNIELFLNDVLLKTKFDFSHGGLHLTKARVERLVTTFPSDFDEDWTF